MGPRYIQLLISILGASLPNTKCLDLRSSRQNWWLPISAKQAYFNLALTGPMPLISVFKLTIDYTPNVTLLSKTPILNPILLIKVLDTNRRPVKVHDIANGDVGRDIHHPEGVLQRRGVAAVVEVVCHVGRRVARRRRPRAPGDVGPAHVRQARRVVGLLPLPPQLVQVRVVQVEARVAGRVGRVAHLWLARLGIASPD